MTNKLVVLHGQKYRRKEEKFDINILIRYVGMVVSIIIAFFGSNINVFCRLQVERIHI